MARVQRLVTCIVEVLYHMAYKKRLPHLNHFSLGCTDHRPGFFLSFNMFKDFIALFPKVEQNTVVKFSYVHPRNAKKTVFLINVLLIDDQAKQLTFN